MDLVTLDGLGLTDTDNIEYLELDELPVSGIPHYSALRNLSVAADIAGAGSFDGVTNEVRNGAALGVSGVGRESGFGVFTDHNGNLYCIVQEDKDAWSVIRDNKLLGNQYYFGGIYRHMGSNGAFEANALMLGGEYAERNMRWGDYVPWGDATGANRTLYPPIPGMDFSTVEHRTIYHICKAIEATGQRVTYSGTNRPIPIVLGLLGEPIVFGDIVDRFFSIVIAVARGFAAQLGIPQPVIDSLVPVLDAIRQGNPVTVRDIGLIAQCLAPAAVRGLNNEHLNRALSTYSYVNTSRYGDAAAQLGIRPDELVTLLKGNFAQTLLLNADRYTALNRTVQNLQNCDTVNVVRALLKTGTARNLVIEYGSMARVPALQNALVTAQSGGLLGTMPGTLELAQAVINETSDIDSIESHRAMILTALGYQAPPAAWDDLTLRSLVERAVQLARNGVDTFVMPASIPWYTRSWMAPEVSRQAGVTVLAGVPDDADEMQNDTAQAEAVRTSETNIWPWLAAGSALAIGGPMLWDWIKGDEK